MPPNECITATCVAGMCGTTNVAFGTATTSQTAGDCLKNQCDGSGAISTVNDDTDVNNDSNPCTADACAAGVPTHLPVAMGTVCGMNQTCDAVGNCLGCTTAATCPGVDDECKTRTCTTGTCGFSFTPAGTTTTAQTAGDCKQSQCDGAGNIAAANDAADLPVDSNTCTSDVCTAGVPSNPPAAAGTACAQNGGTICNGAGACVQCAIASDCPGSDTDCHIRTCTAGACGVFNVAAGNPTTTQTTGNCQINQCDGNGNAVNAADNTDVPVDSNQCTGDVCTAGTPSNPPTAAGSVCAQNGGTSCDGAGACVASASCSDGLKDGAETDVDCGGGACAACALTKACTAASDCASANCITGLCGCANPGGTHLVISEVRSRGAGGAADEFVEIYNPTSAPVTLDNTWTLSAASSTSSTYSLRWTGSATKIIPARGHFLIAGTAYTQSPTKDDALSTGITDASSLVLKSGTTVVDAVCYSFDATTTTTLQQAAYTCEGAPLSNLPHNNATAGNLDVSFERRPAGNLGSCVDSNTNTSDFATGVTPATPQSSLSPVTP